MLIPEKHKFEIIALKASLFSFQLTSPLPDNTPASISG